MEKNIFGTLQLIEAGSPPDAGRFVFISTGAVHEKILEDRPLDENHPTAPLTHYGAHKAALEQFVHSYGWGMKYPICALRPTGVYGVAHPASDSKWFELVRAVIRGDDVHCTTAGKEVHAADVAKAAAILLSAPNIAGEAFNCYDRYVSAFEVASLAKELTGSRSLITGVRTAAKNQIVTAKLQYLGMQFGGETLLQQTVRDLVAAAK